jgi:hypothetical protein
VTVTGGLLPREGLGRHEENALRIFTHVKRLDK